MTAILVKPCTVTIIVLTYRSHFFYIISSSDFGDDDLEILVEHFSPVLSKAGFNAEEIYTEWQMLKNMIYERFETTHENKPNEN